MEGRAGRIDFQKNAAVQVPSQCQHSAFIDVRHHNDLFCVYVRGSAGDCTQGPVHARQASTTELYPSLRQPYL